MDRRAFSRVAAGIVLTTALALKAQSARSYRIGWLGPGPATSEAFDPFRRALRDLGYTEGQNVTFDLRLERRNERLPSLAAELVAGRPDVIVAVTTPAARAAKQATSTIPIVMTFVSDPVGTGLVSSLAHPGGNVTGVTDFGVDIAAKALELLRAVAPNASSVAVLMSGNPAHPAQFKEIQGAATPLGLIVLREMARALEDLEQAFASAKRNNVGAVIVLGGPPHSAQREQIAKLAVASALPTIFLNRFYVDAGGLLSYGPILAEMFTIPATLVDRILKGAKPEDLPVEQPTKFELVINLKTAKDATSTLSLIHMRRCRRS
jgi:putative ABC transport system substrate-binding protein